MAQARRSKQNQAIRRTAIVRSGQTMFSVTMFSLVILIVMVGFRLFGPQEKPVIKIPQPAMQAAPAVNISTNPQPDLASSYSVRDLTKPLVGIV
jgi:tellurite resistance protein TehA-like permease